eukprot:366157-Chlamydomonas_euryale.AAC.14
MLGRCFRGSGRGPATGSGGCLGGGDRLRRVPGWRRQAQEGAWAAATGSGGCLGGGDRAPRIRLTFWVASRPTPRLLWTWRVAAIVYARC